MGEAARCDARARLFERWRLARALSRQSPLRSIEHLLCLLNLRKLVVLSDVSDAMELYTNHRGERFASFPCAKVVALEPGGATYVSTYSKTEEDRISSPLCALLHQTKKESVTAALAAIGSIWLRFRHHSLRIVQEDAKRSALEAMEIEDRSSRGTVDYDRAKLPPGQGEELQIGIVQHLLSRFAVQDDF